MSKKPNVLIIYTGGTIGMINNPETGALMAFDFEHLYAKIPELKQFDYHIDVFSIPNPIDSSEMNIDNWKFLAKTIFEKYDKYDGFVILHGSDTMAYTASALSFMIQGIKKPIILTGSQLPIGQIRTDGKENLITAIEIAGLKDEKNESIVQEVAIYFEYSLYRGNRASKISANHFEAFDSPNFPPLAIAGINIEFNQQILFRTTLKKPELFLEINPNIAVVKVFPGMPISYLESVFEDKKLEAVIMETFGSGNIFSSQILHQKMKNYVENGGIIMNTTQCLRGSIKQGKYDAGKIFIEIDAISGNDITTEAAITKLMYVLGKEKTKSERIKLMKKNLCGEILLDKN